MNAVLPAAPADTSGWAGFFDELAPEYNDVAFGTAGLARVSAGELGAVRFGLASVDAGHVLDGGAGTGRVTGLLRSLGWRVTALDASTAMLATLRGAHPEVPGVHGMIGAPLPFTDEMFDAVVSLRVL